MLKPKIKENVTGTIVESSASLKTLAGALLSMAAANLLSRYGGERAPARAATRSTARRDRLPAHQVLPVNTL